MPRRSAARCARRERHVPDGRRLQEGPERLVFPRGRFVGDEARHVRRRARRRGRPRFAFDEGGPARAVRPDEHRDPCRASVRLGTAEQVVRRTAGVSVRDGGGALPGVAPTLEHEAVDPLDPCAPSPRCRRGRVRHGTSRSGRPVERGAGEDPSRTGAGHRAISRKDRSRACPRDPDTPTVAAATARTRATVQGRARRPIRPVGVPSRGNRSIPAPTRTGTKPDSAIPAVAGTPTFLAVAEVQGVALPCRIAKGRRAPHRLVALGGRGIRRRARSPSRRVRHRQGLGRGAVDRDRSRPQPPAASTPRAASMPRRVACSRAGATPG